MKKKKIKSYIKIIILIVIIVFIYRFISNCLKTNHSVQYEVNNYKIVEKLSVYNKKHFYFLSINNKYEYSFNKDIHKKSKIIKNIISIKNGKNTCLFPIYVDNSRGIVLCDYNDEIVGLDYLKEVDINKYKSVLKEFKKYNYDVSINDSDSSIKYKKLKIYKNNLDSNYTFTLWDYRGLYKINKDNITYNKLLNEDKYDNKYASIVGDYYVYVDTNKIAARYTLNVYNMLKEKEDIYVVDEDDNLSDNIEFLGNYNDLLYLYDLDNMLEYTFNPKKMELNEVGNRDNGYYIVSNNRLKVVDYYKFKDNMYFNNRVEDNKIKKFYDYVELYEVDNYYYLYDSDGNFYKIYKDNIKNGILLFKLDNISDVVIKDNIIMTISDGNLYYYVDSLKKIVSYNELKYNYNNIIDIYEK